VQGRTPAAPNELVASDDFLRASGAKIGDTLSGASGYDPQLRSLTGRRTFVLVGRAHFFYMPAEQRAVALPIATLQGMRGADARDRASLFMIRARDGVDVEAWLRRLPIARSSRAKIRSILSILFNHACRYELFDRNPMRFVRQGAKRRSAPNVLTAAEIKALVDHLPLRERTLVLLAAATGLRQSELFGLKWRDVDFKRGELSVIRSIVFGVVGRCKTESSQKPVPLHPLLGEALLAWRKTCKFTGADDWIFASRLHKGRRPYWGASILRNYVRPVAMTLNIQKRIGWHTFRHTYSTLLRSVGAEFKVMQELMRHSTLRTTMDVYTQAVAPAKHAAQAAVLALFFPMADSPDDDIIVGTA